MRVIFWFMDRFEYEPAIKTLESADTIESGKTFQNAIVAFVHGEAEDESKTSKVTTKLIKHLKWLAKKWDCQRVILHSFAHLSESKSEPQLIQQIFNNARERLTEVGYEVELTPFGYFLDIQISAPGRSLARVYKEF